MLCERNVLRGVTLFLSQLSSITVLLSLNNTCQTKCIKSLQELDLNIFRWKNCLTLKSAMKASEIGVWLSFKNIIWFLFSSSLCDALYYFKLTAKKDCLIGASPRNIVTVANDNYSLVNKEVWDLQKYETKKIFLFFCSCKKWWLLFLVIIVESWLSFLTYICYIFRTAALAILKVASKIRFFSSLSLVSPSNFFSVARISLSPCDQSVWKWGRKEYWVPYYGRHS